MEDSEEIGLRKHLNPMGVNAIEGALVGQLADGAASSTKCVDRPTKDALRSREALEGLRASIR